MPFLSRLPSVDARLVCGWPSDTHRRSFFAPFRPSATPLFLASASPIPNDRNAYLRAAAHDGGPPWLQSARLVAAIAELGSLAHPVNEAKPTESSVFQYVAT